MLASARWRTVSWRSGTKGRLKARFAAVRVRTADGPPQRIWDKGQQHLPGDEAWLIGEHRASGEKKYYLANLAAGMDLRSLAATSWRGRIAAERTGMPLNDRAFQIEVRSKTVPRCPWRKSWLGANRG